MFANPDIRDGCGVEVIDFAHSGEADSNDIWLHEGNYTVVQVTA
jgi:hypothetical protein